MLELIDDLGFDPVYLGKIDQSLETAARLPIYCRDIGQEELKRRVDNLGINWSEMRQIILEKRKTDEAVMKTDYQAYLKSLQD